MTARVVRKLSAIIVAILLAFASGVCVANDTPYWFAGAGIGGAHIGGYEFVAQATSVSDDVFGWRIYGGRRLLRRLAVSAGYADLGTLKASGGTAINFSDRVEAKAWDVTANGIVLMRDRFELYGLLGFVRWNQKVRLTVEGEPFQNDSTSGSGATAGGGMNIFLPRNLMLNLEARRHVEVGDIFKTGREHRRDLYTVGVSFPFGR